MAGALDAQDHANPPRIDGVVFARSNPLSEGAILADEVGRGTLIEAQLLVAQK